MGNAPPGVPLFGTEMVANVTAGMLRAAKTDKESGMNFMGTLKKIFVSLVDRFLLVEEPFKFRRVWLASSLNGTYNPRLLLGHRKRGIHECAEKSHRNECLCARSAQFF